MFRLPQFFILAVFFTVIANAYDWEDSDFNMILQQDLSDDTNYFEDEYIMPVHYRVARDVSTTTPRLTEESTECKNKAPQNNNSSGNNRFQKACCGDKEDLKMHGDALKELRRECFAEVRKARAAKAEESGPVDMFNCEKVSKSKEELICVMECVARKKEMADPDGNILAKDVTKFVKDELATKDWQKDIIDKVIAKCLQEANMTKESTRGKQAPATATTEKKCNPSTLKFSHCIWREMQLSCPKDLIRDTRQCQKMRERLQKKDSPNFDNGNKSKQRPKNGPPNDGPTKDELPKDAKAA